MDSHSPTGRRDRKPKTKADPPQGVTRREKRGPEAAITLATQAFGIKKARNFSLMIYSSHVRIRVA
jgi:hypothetical protein